MDKDYEYRANGNGQLWEMKNKLEEYQKKQNKWNQEREKLKKNLLLMEQEIKKQKNINSTLLKRASHKRTCSDEPTFIFNQTNISSYYPVVLMNQKQKQQKTNNKNMDSNTKVGKDESPISSPNQPLINQNINSKSKGLSNIAQYADLNLSSQSNTNTHVTCSNNRNLNLSNTAPTNNSWVPRANLRSHLDSVRTLRWQGQFLISAGQDCLLKIWDKDKLRITVRQHLAPVFTLCGDEKTVFSGGAEGVVRKWVVDEFMESARPVAQAQLHDDSIWDMIWLSNHALLITSSSDSSIKLIRSQTSNSLVLSSQINVNPQITTSICALPNQQLACGVVKNPKMLLFNIEKPHKPAQFVPFEHQTSPNFQPNKLLLYSPKNLLVSGHQDHVIRLFDLNSNKSIGNIVAHSDAVTSLCIREGTKKQHEIISSSHDGTVRVWDVRKWKCVHDIGVHMKKYDESLLALAFSAELDLLAVGGADGQIKLLSPQI